MEETTLDQVQRLVAKLPLHEQAHLMASLAIRMAQEVASTSSPPPGTPSMVSDPWAEFFRIGDDLAFSDSPELETLTTSVLKMRR